MSDDETKAKADAGDVGSQYVYGSMLLTGLGGPNRGAEAARYLKMAADGGNATAQMDYAMLLMRGREIEKNEEEAIKLIKLSAAQNYILAQMFLEARGIT
jgi:TPR repeat protein